MTQMRRSSGFRFNYRERTLLPRLIFTGIVSLVVLAMHVEATAAAQQQPSTAPVSASAPVFDVASIHIYIPEPHERYHIWSSPTDGHFKAQNVTLGMLIDWAYDTPETRTLGAPGWVGTTRFGIDATADSAVDEQLQSLPPQEATLEKRKMVQALLADRFRLVTHTETRELPIYNLVVAKGGAKLGPVEQSGSFVNTWDNRFDLQMSDSVATLAEELSKVVGRDIVDKTGIAGRYHLILNWTPDDAAGTGSDPSSPSLFTALEEQLGLKLEPAKGPVQVLIVDHVEMPSSN
jgi:uncharacterized protein (TIGR03435 family)